MFMCVRILENKNIAHEMPICLCGDLKKKNAEI